MCYAIASRRLDADPITTFACKLAGGDVDISTLVRKPTWFKWTLMPFAYIMQTTADHGNLSHEHWIIDFAMAVHHFPPTLESAKCLLYNTSSTNQAVVEAVLLGWQTTSFVALHASCSQWKGCICNKKRIHLHSFNCLWRVCKPFTASYLLVTKHCAEKYTSHQQSQVDPNLPLASTHPNTIMALKHL